MKKYFTYQEAKDYVQALNLSSQTEWKKYIKNNQTPSQLPRDPWTFYKKINQWISWGDFLGTGAVAPSNREYVSYNEAKEYVQLLNLSTQKEWREYINNNTLPPEIPNAPEHFYKKNNQWNGWGDFLGTKRIANQNRKYLSYNEARDYAQSLNLSSRPEWEKYIKNNTLPPEIPNAPEHFYKKNNQWNGWGDFLGTGYIANQNREYFSFNEARDYAQSLNLSSKTDWEKYIKNNTLPAEMPRDIYNSYGKSSEWISWGDFFGTGFIAPCNREYVSYQKAKDYVQSLNLASQTKWKEYIKNNVLPMEIPRDPQGVYNRANEWVSWGDFLGTGTVASSNREYVSYNEAKDYVQSLNLSSSTEWEKYIKNNILPSEIPNGPDRVYKRTNQWISWGDFLGTGYIATSNREYVSYDEAKKYAQTLNLSTQQEWREYIKNNVLPMEIPRDPQGVYKRASEWVSWGDFLGTGCIANQNKKYVSYSEAKEYVQSLKLSSQKQWREYIKNNTLPFGIPNGPDGVYSRTNEWIGFADFLGYKSIMNKNNLLKLLYDLRDTQAFTCLEPAEMAVILNQAGIPLSGKMNNKNSSLIKNLSDLVDTNLSDEYKNKKLDEIINEVDVQTQDQIDDVFDNDETNNTQEIVSENLTDADVFDFVTKPIKPKEINSLDELIKKMPYLADSEAIQFLIKNKMKKLINIWLRNDGDLSNEEIQDILNYDNKGIFYTQIVNNFMSLVDDVNNFVLPNGYSFKKLQNDAEITEPLPMQKLVAVILKNNQYLLNMSGTGAGKTVAAILASRHIKSKLTLIVACNATIQEWEKVIYNCFPDSLVVAKDRSQTKFDTTTSTYVLLNFETFQQGNSSGYAEMLMENNKFDFIIIDEIHNIKKTDNEHETKRLQVLKYVRQKAQEKNPELRVLGCSATPVINNLIEGKNLLKFVTGLEYDELVFKVSNISNALALHSHFINNGIRFIPNYQIKKTENIIEIDCSSEISRLSKLAKSNLLDMEKALIELKMPTIIDNLTKGTIIYSHYVDGSDMRILTSIKQEVERSGFSCGIFSGDDKSGIDKFKNGKLDVLIASKPIATGVDGLQYVSNKLIMASLPWTSADYDQLVGRINRQGSNFTSVEIIIPKVVIKDKEDNCWSYDQQRIDRIHYKRTLADCAVDGIISRGELSSPELLAKKAKKALSKWIERIEIEGNYEIERKLFDFPLPEDKKQNCIRKYGDFSMLNNKWNNSKSTKTNMILNENPEEWYLYHTLYSEARKTWSEIPYEVIAEKILSGSERVHVADLGCGEALLAELLEENVSKIYSFDHVAINENVIACDMSKLPLEENEVDVAVFSLSLMGSNYLDYIMEAYRILVYDGRLYVAETNSRWDKAEIIEKFEKVGFKLVETKITDKFIYLDFIKK